MPYEWNWSQDVEKCTLDLVLSSFKHTNAVQAIAVASTGARFSHQSPQYRRPRAVIGLSGRVLMSGLA